MAKTWNLTSEVLRRENNFSDRWEIRERNSEPFHRSILASEYIAHQIDTPRLVGEKYGNSLAFNFNKGGDLLIMSASDKRIAIYDWAHNKLLHDFKQPEHPSSLQDILVINADNGSLDIVTTCTRGKVRRSRITPGGDVISTLLATDLQGFLQLIAVPNSPHELLGVSTDGSIFQIDLRCEQAPCSIVTRLESDSGGFSQLFAVAHHPYSPEICIGGINVFGTLDKRNLTGPIKEISPEIVKRPFKVWSCGYNYDGTEILAKYNKQFYLFDQHNGTKIGEDGKAYSSVSFFGPKSEFLACVDERLNFFRKNNKKIKVSGSDEYSRVTRVRPHPFLPVIACSSFAWEGVSIWAPVKK